MALETYNMHLIKSTITNFVTMKKYGKYFAIHRCYLLTVTPKAKKRA